MINFQLSAFEQLLPNAAWAGQQRVVQGLGNPGRSRSQVIPRSSIMGQTSPHAAAAAWLGTLSARQSQAPFSRAVCAHICRAACSWWNHSIEWQGTQEKLPQKNPFLSELYLKAEYCFLSVAERHWWTLLSTMTPWPFWRCPVPLKEEQFLFQVQFSNENIHFIDLIQDNNVIS